MDTANKKNFALSSVLNDLGWSHSRTMKEINAYMGDYYVGRSSVAEWVTKGRIPRDPLPTVMAHLLSDATGRTITVEQLWGEGTKESQLWLPADHDRQNMTWDPQGVLRSARDWTDNAGKTMHGDRREFMAISGVSLTGFAWEFTEKVSFKPFAKFSGVSGSSRSVKITPSIVKILESTVKDVELLDHREGSKGNNLKFMSSVFDTVAGYVKEANVSDETTWRRLLTVWAQLCRLGGFMAFDSGKHGLGQRYFYTGLQVAGTLGSPEIGAHILTHMCHQAVYIGKHGDAAQLAEAAVETAEKCGDDYVKTFVASRCALGQASSGNSYACKAFIGKARDLMTSLDNGDKSSYLYWLSHSMLDTHASEALSVLSGTTQRRMPKLMDEAHTLMAPHLSDSSDFRTGFPRDTLLRGLFLARGYLRQGEVDRAVETGTKLLPLVSGINSYRTAMLIDNFKEELSNQYKARGGVKVAELAGNLS